MFVNSLEKIVSYVLMNGMGERNADCLHGVRLKAKHSPTVKADYGACLGLQELGELTGFYGQSATTR